MPSHRTSFIGRAAELAEVGRLLRRGHGPRLLTLVGPGGCGKTRLALQAVADMPAAELPAGGVWWIELAGLADPALVPQAVAEGLGLREAPPQPLAETIANFLHDRPSLLILDNCEHLIAACAGLVASLLGACPGLRVLATSREALGQRDEAAWPVPPLSLPGPEERPAPEALPAYDAIRLFVERARHDLPAFRITGENSAAIVEVCRQLDGLPLAIELAAARVPLLRVEQIAARLSDRLRLLTGGRAADAPRQQTLRATLDWSHNLLTDQERGLFRRLAVFAGGWTLEAAEAVGAEGDVMDGLAQLVRKSLVVVEREPGQEARFRLLDSVRQYSWERLLEAGEREAASQRHLAYYLRLAEAARPHLGFFLPDAETAAWMARLRPELDNLRAALEWSAQDPDRSGAGLRLVSALHWFWMARGYFTEARDWLARLLEIGRSASAAVRAQALTTAGWLACWQGAFAAARSPLEEGLRLCRELDDRWGIAFNLHALGWVASAQGEGAKGRELTEACLAIARRLGDQWLISFALHFLGIGAAFQGDFPAARAHFDECITLMRQLGGNTTGLAFSLFHLGRMDRLEGQYAASEAHYREALRLFQALGDPRGVAYVLAGLASLAAARGQMAQAARLSGTVAALRASVGSFLEAPLQVEFDRDLASARAALAPEAFAAAWAEGQAALGNVFEPAIERALLGAEAEAPPTRPEPSSAESAPAVLEASPQPELRLLGLGPAQVQRGDYVLRPSDWSFARPKQILFFLLTYPHRTREQIGLVFWPDASPAQLRNGLRTALYHLRRALGRPEWVLFEDEHYAFNRALNYWYDVEAFEAAVAEAGRLEAEAPERAAERLQATVGLYQGDFLEDFPAGDWLVARREELRRKYLQVLLSLGRLRLAAGRQAEAAEAYRQAIAHDGYLEAAHRGLMRCWARQGEPGQALRQYQGLLALLRDELGLAPSAETTALFDRLRRGEAI
jgi:predicted ATPase/DNA-binding SARP family transcriptional activator